MIPVRLQSILGSARKCRVLVVGDLMLDRFIWGKVSRISPEAPVPVVEVTHESSYPGGAANVARNLRPFCSEVVVAGRAGDDGSGVDLLRRLEEEGIRADGVERQAEFSTIVKTRVIARQQQVVRVDRERKDPMTSEETESCVARILASLAEVDAVVLEDYGKGFLTSDLVRRVIDGAVAAGKLVTVDPNPNNPQDWRGAQVVKPNRSEAFAAAGVPVTEPAENPLEDKPLLQVGERLREKWGVPNLLVTLGEDGILLISEGEVPYHAPTRAQEVFDVSGAGDTTIALFTLALAGGATPGEAAEIANHAAGVVVGKLGTATLSPQELLESFDGHAE